MMLAQNFKTAIDLGISEHERTALIGVLGLLERGELRHVTVWMGPPPKETRFSGLFNMACYRADTECGTAGCIAGTADMLYGTFFEMKMDRGDYPDELGHLFLGFGRNSLLMEVTTEQAAQALRNYLTTGAPNWKRVQS